MVEKGMYDIYKKKKTTKMPIFKLYGPMKR